MKRMMSRRSGSFFLLLTVLAFSPTIAEGAQTKAVKIPHSVTGLTITPDDPLALSMTLEWDPASKAEGVDKYAIYLLNANLDRVPPTLVTVTKQTKISLKTWDSGIQNGKQPKDTIFLVPDVDVSMYVIAHNKYGWGLSWPGSVYPDQTKPPVLSKSQQHAYVPRVAHGYWQCSAEFKEYHNLESC